jgi:putative ribosome biogenesis GTPase RsgA
MHYNLLLIAHVICADRQIHSEEVKYLNALSEQNGADATTLELIDKIFAQADNCPSVADVAKNISVETRPEVFLQVLEVAHVDGNFSPLERDIIDTIAKIWNLSASNVQIAIAQADNNYRQSQSQKLIKDERVELSLSAKVLKGAESVFSRGLVKKLAEAAPVDIGQKIEQLQREVLLSGPEYDEAIQKCAKIAREDYKFAELRLKQTGLVLQQLQENINIQIEKLQKLSLAGGKGGSAKEAIEQISQTKQALEVKILRQLQDTRMSLDSKARALSHFSITFMGKTKAGKSTLHAVVTGEGWNAIGVGKQRTTRLNRVYEWKHIRIIDTPGIGAPDGHSDEEITKSVIDESDVICYVVTNDSVQESEFKFLSILESKSKPLIILLNLKNNLRDTRRLKSFLDNPEKLFSMKGNNDLTGHIDRIRTYAQKHYSNNSFEIIPVMLLAAQLSQEEEHKEIKSDLLKASKLKNFLDIIRESIVVNGVIRRSQTFLGSTAGDIESHLDRIKSEIKACEKLLLDLKKKRGMVKVKITTEEDRAETILQNKIKTSFQQLRGQTNSFALQNYKDDSELISQKWNDEVTKMQLKENLEIACNQASESYNKGVAEILGELGRDLQLVSQLSGSSFNIENTYDGFNMKIGGKILAVAGVLIGFVFPQLGIAIGAIGAVIGWLGGLFKSEEDNRREAVEKIEQALKSQIDIQESQIIEQSTDNLHNQCQNISSAVDVYLGGLIVGLEIILKELTRAEKDLQLIIKELNLGYGKRILDYYEDKYEHLTLGTARAAIASVERDREKQMTIDLNPNYRIPTNLLDPKYQESLGKILQERVSITQSKKTKLSNIYN